MYQVGDRVILKDGERGVIEGQNLFGEYFVLVDGEVAVCLVSSTKILRKE